MICEIGLTLRARLEDQLLRELIVSNEKIAAFFDDADEHLTIENWVLYHWQAVDLTHPYHLHIMKYLQTLVEINEDEGYLVVLGETDRDILIRGYATETPFQAGVVISFDYVNPQRPVDDFDPSW